MISYEKRSSLLLEKLEIEEILKDIRLGIHRILCGEAQSYTVNSIQVNRRNMSLKDLMDLEKYYRNRLGEIEAELAGLGSPAVKTFIPTDF